MALILQKEGPGGSVSEYVKITHYSVDTIARTISGRFSWYRDQTYRMEHPEDPAFSVDVTKSDFSPLIEDCLLDVLYAHFKTLEHFSGAVDA